MYYLYASNSWTESKLSTSSLELISFVWKSVIKTNQHKTASHPQDVFGKVSAKSCYVVQNYERFRGDKIVLSENMT